MKFQIPVILLIISLSLITPALALKNNDDQTITPIIFHDPVTKNYIYIESDGRHVTSFATDGTLLWHRNPFIDADLKPYRVTKPVIRSIERVKNLNNWIVIRFNSSQFISIDAESGDSTPLGQR